MAYKGSEQLLLHNYTLKSNSNEALCFYSCLNF